MRTPRFVFALFLFGVGCSGSASLGSDHDPLKKVGAGGGMSAGVGGTSVAPGTGGGAQGGSTANAGTGGSAIGTAATGSGGTEPSGGGSAGASTGGSGQSAGTSGAKPDGGTSGMTAGGAGGSSGMGGAAGMDMGQAGEGPIVPDAPTKVDDPDALGDGPCASESARDVLAAIHAAYPDLADIGDFYDPRYIGDPTLVYPYTSDAGFSMVLARGAGDCPAGCIDWDYWYFQTDESCVPHQVGSYSAHSGPCNNGYTVKGQPMWGMPDHTPTAICSSTI